MLYHVRYSNEFGIFPRFFVLQRTKRHTEGRGGHLKGIAVSQKYDLIVNLTFYDILRSSQCIQISYE